MTVLPDYAPSAASRVVQIKAMDLGEADWADETLYVDFVIPEDLHVGADGSIIMASAERVRLVEGLGQVRLPSVDPDTLTVGGNPPTIMVQKSWDPDSYPIVVPAGSGPIALASIPPSNWTTDLARIYALTGVGLIVTTASYAEGASGTVTLSAGVPTFNLRIPRGAPGLGNASIEQESNGLWKVNENATANSAQDWAAQALGYYLLEGPATTETERNGLPVYFIGGN